MSYYVLKIHQKYVFCRLAKISKRINKIQKKYYDIYIILRNIILVVLYILSRCNGFGTKNKIYLIFYNKNTYILQY